MKKVLAMVAARAAVEDSLVDPKARLVPHVQLPVKPLAVLAVALGIEVV